jgi:hypothetical protein
MITQITVDGHSYEVEHAKYGSQQEDVYVRTLDGEVVGSAEIYHDMEQIVIVYNENDDGGTYSYWEYKGPESIAAWIASTSY